MPSSEALYEDVCQKQKRLALFFVGATLTSILLCAVARYVAPVNDWFSGRPRYARVIANILGQDIARKLGGIYPVIVMEHQDPSCQPIGSKRAKAADIYVISYSERTRSLCVTQWQVRKDLNPKQTLTIDDSIGHNYGRQLHEPVPVMPVQRYLLNFPDAFLSSLHWRSTSGQGVLHSDSQILQLRNLSIERALQGFSIDIPSLRSKVAERHSFLNRALSLSLGLMIAAFAIAVCCTGVLYRRVRRDCAVYGFRLRLPMYLRTNVGEITNQAHESYCAQHCQRQAELRAEKILRHAFQTTHECLQAQLETTSDDQQRARIDSCLGRHDLEEMNSLLQELQSQPREKTPTERLASLLESLKDYCVDVDFEPYRREAFEIFRNYGFRAARYFVVHAHQELRLHARQREREQLKNGNGNCHNKQAVGDNPSRHSSVGTDVSDRES